MKGLAILGSTGSVGTNVLRVAEAFPDRFRVIGLAGGRNAQTLAAQVGRHRPRVISVADASTREALARLVDLSAVQVGVGEEGMVEVATHSEAQLVVAAAVGAVGLVPTYRALEAGKDVALANKETLVMAGELMTAQARARGVSILPIDSEHCALHQCLDGRSSRDVRRLVLTASGGPFRSRPRDTFATITREEALNHPTWNMGRKITIDSATLMNKGLEVIEARWLFDLPAERIEVLVHPQSVVHSMVEFVDGTVLTQAMRLDFEPPDREKFPCLGLAYEAITTGGTRPAALNAANEEAVAAFLDGRISFPAIAESIHEVLCSEPRRAVGHLEDVLEADRGARARARQLFRPAAVSQ
jgi:1-deoxy-D-xylulose-5-phosphate reductoisomerase